MTSHRGAHGEEEDTVAVTTYSSLFNTNPFFKQPHTVILDDAHSAENYIANFWSVEIDKNSHAAAFSALSGVIILSGKYEAKPLPERKKDLIEIYGFELTDRTTGGGGSGNLQEMADHIEGFIESRIVIGAVQGAPKEVEWHFNSRSPATAQQRAQDTDAESVMKNLTAQTGLTAKLEKRKIKILVVKKPK